MDTCLMTCRGERASQGSEIELQLPVLPPPNSMVPDQSQPLWSHFTPNKARGMDKRGSVSSFQYRSMYELVIYLLSKANNHPQFPYQVLMLDVKSTM